MKNSLKIVLCKIITLIIPLFQSMTVIFLQILFVGDEILKLSQIIAFIILPFLVGHMLVFFFYQITIAILPYFLLHSCMGDPVRLHHIMTTVILPLLQHFFVGDKVATTKTLLTVRCLHARNASTRAP